MPQQDPLIRSDKPFVFPWWLIILALALAVGWRLKNKIQLSKIIDQAPIHHPDDFSKNTLDLAPIESEPTRPPPRPDLINQWYLDASKFSPIGQPRFEEEAIYLDQPAHIESGLAYGRNGLEYAGPLIGPIDAEIMIDLKNTSASDDFSTLPDKPSILSITLDVGALPRTAQIIAVPVNNSGIGQIISSMGSSEIITPENRVLIIKLTRLDDQILATMILDDAPEKTLGALAAGSFNDSKGQPITRIAIEARRYDPSAQGNISFAIRSIIVSCLNINQPCGPKKSKY